MKNYSERDLVYLAGFFDGEGHAGLSKDKGGRYKPRFQIGNTHLGVLKWIAEKFGGNVCLAYEKHTRKDVKYNKTCFTWYAHQPDIKYLLLDLIPLLKVRNQQAALLLEYINKRKHFGRNGRPSWYIKWEGEVYHRMTQMNHENIEQHETLCSLEKEGGNRTLFDYEENNEELAELV